jgi:hypothetical protein
MLINNFTSTWFVNNYVLTDRLAAHIRASHFSQILKTTSWIVRAQN